MGTFLKTLKSKKLKAQGIMEFGLAFIFIVLLFYTVAEYSFFWQAIHSTQTFADDLNANLALFNGSEVCNSPNTEVLNLATNKAHRYFNNSIELQYDTVADKRAKIISTSSYNGKQILKINITCDSELDNSTSTRAEYLYHGLFLFKTGHEISSLASMHTPRF